MIITCIVKQYINLNEITHNFERLSYQKIAIIILVIIVG